MKDYIEALLKELALKEKFFKKASTIYVGGGTPTTLSEGLLDKLLTSLELYRENEETEFTIEANPATITREKLKVIKRCGVNRLSIGIQTFNNEGLKRIGRLHDAECAERAYYLARECGFQNISIDLIYALPKQTFSELKEDVEYALKLKPEHISIYGLTVEEGTLFDTWQKEGTLFLPCEDEAEAMYDYLTNTLPIAGYERYEISNFARPSFMSKHNNSYWHDVSYIGLGAGAHSYHAGKRFENTPIVEDYIKAISKNIVPETLEDEGTKDIRMGEFIFLSLRTAVGVEKRAFKMKFGENMEDIYAKEILKLKRDGLIIESSTHIFLTEKGMKYGNVAFREFV